MAYCRIVEALKRERKLEDLSKEEVEYDVECLSLSCLDFPKEQFHLRMKQTVQTPNKNFIIAFADFVGLDKECPFFWRLVNG